MADVSCIDLETGKEVGADGLPSKTVLCLGFFDGIHLAHEKLFEETDRLAKKILCPPGVWFFRTAPFKRTAYLTDFEEKLESFRDHGLKYAFYSDFDTLKDYSPSSFIDRILKVSCRCVGVVCGFNFTFGKDAAGSPSMLKEAFQFCETVPEQTLEDGRIVSSSSVRDALSEGDVKTAEKMLGRPYSLCGTVAHGNHYGAALGFPTANIYPDPERVCPRPGVYVTRVECGDKKYGAVTDVGFKPTVGSEKLVCESHLLDFTGDLYGRQIRVCFLERLRDEQKFGDLSALKEQILIDKSQVEKYFHNK